MGFSRAEMLASLGLSSGPQDASADCVEIAAAGSEQTVSANRNLFAFDEWTERRGYEIAHGHGTESNPVDMCDFHSMLFDPNPVRLESCSDARKVAFVDQIMSTPEYVSLRKSTKLNEVATVKACLSIAAQYAELIRDKPESAPEAPKTIDEKLAALMGKGKPTGDKVKADKDGEEMAVLRAACAGVDEASKDVEEMMGISATCGEGGLGKGTVGRFADPQESMKLFARVKNSAKLRNIIETAGRYRLVARSKQQRKVTHGMDDMVGVTLADEIARLVPAELCNLVIPELELDTLRRIVGGEAQCREHNSVENVGKGPIIISVDESGSMHGKKIANAKGLALALAWIARTQGRWCALVAYSGDTGERTLALPPSNWDENKVLDWLEPFIDGGSDMDIPVREMPGYYKTLGAPEGKTDVIMITDAKISASDHEKAFKRFNDWKAEVKARVISLVLIKPSSKRRWEDEDIKLVSDEVHMINDLNPSDSAVGEVLAI